MHTAIPGSGLAASALLLALIMCASLASRAGAQWDTRPDTWSAVDGLGRAVPGSPEVPAPRADRFVGIFYFLWLGAHVNGGPYDLTEILAKDPDAVNHPDSPLFGPMGAFHHWGEPLFGYYVNDDEYVLRKHAQMLTDAGVDTLIFDTTNNFTYRDHYRALLRVFAAIRAEGGRTPQVAFLCPFGDPSRVVRELYADLYEPGLYSDLWFQWRGKPLILANPDFLQDGIALTDHNQPVALEPGHTLGQSFVSPDAFDSVAASLPTWSHSDSSVTLTLRESGPDGEIIASGRFERFADNAWLRLELAPAAQAGRYYLEISDPEGTVGWWSHTEDRLPEATAYADGVEVAGDRCLLVRSVEGPNAALRGFFTFRTPEPSYFVGPSRPDMWAWLEVSPQHVWRNSVGEAEMMAVGVGQNAVDGKLSAMSEPGALGRSYHDGAFDDRPGAMLEGLNVAEQWERALAVDPEFVFLTGWNEWIAQRFTSEAGRVMFVDQYDAEHSRDIEPAKGELADHYYYQMVSYIRRYKGARTPEPASPPVTIDLAGDFSQWDTVGPEFRDDAGDPSQRDHKGYNDFTQYRNDTGRNDILVAKVARDADNVYFTVRTREPLTPSSDPDWMVLYLDTDEDPTTGWEGFDFVVNRQPPDATGALLEASASGWGWVPRARVPFRVAGDRLMLAIPRSALGLAPDQPVRLQLKWADHCLPEGDPLAFVTNGDAAPNGRFRYRYAE